MRLVLLFMSCPSTYMADAADDPSPQGSQGSEVVRFGALSTEVLQCILRYLGDAFVWTKTGPKSNAFVRNQKLCNANLSCQAFSRALTQRFEEGKVYQCRVGTDMGTLVQDFRVTRVTRQTVSVREVYEDGRFMDKCILKRSKRKQLSSRTTVGWQENIWLNNTKSRREVLEAGRKNTTLTD